MCPVVYFAREALRRLTKRRYAPGNTFGQLTEESEPRVNVVPLPYACNEPAIQLRARRIVYGRSGVYFESNASRNRVRASCKP